MKHAICRVESVEVLGGYTLMTAHAMEEMAEDHLDITLVQNRV